MSASRKKHQAGPEAKTDSMGAHVALEPAALVNAERCIASAMEYGFVGPLDMPPEAMPTPDLVTVAGVARAAWSDGRKGWTEVMG